MTKKKSDINFINLENIQTADETDVDLNNIDDSNDSDHQDLLKSVREPKVQENLSSVNSDDSVRIYLQQIGKIPLLSSEEELQIAKKIREHDCEMSKNILVNANLRLVVSIDKK